MSGKNAFVGMIILVQPVQRQARCKVSRPMEPRVMHFLGEALVNFERFW